MAISLNLNQPWTTDEELLEWYSVAYNQDRPDGDEGKIRDYTWARDVVQKWRVRSRSVELEAVSLLLTAELEYLKSKSTKDEFDYCIIASLFSTAVIRFCEVLRHYIIDDDGEITRCAHPKTLTKKLSDSLNVPSWIIDLRHEACHAKTPPLTLLRQASFIIQDWLQVNFWTSKILKAEKFEFGKVSRLIQSYCSKPSDENRSIIVSALKENHHKILRAVVHQLTLSIDPSDIPADVDFENLSVRPHIRKNMNPLVHLIMKQCLIQDLLHLLINVFCLKEDCTNLPAIIWFKEIVSRILTMTGDQSKAGRAAQDYSSLLKNNSSVQVTFLRVVHHLCYKPVIFTPPLLKMMAILFKDTSHHDMVERSASFTSIFMGCNGFMNGSVEALEFQAKDADTLKRILSTTPRTNPGTTKQAKRVKFSS